MWSCVRIPQTYMIGINELRNSIWGSYIAREINKSSARPESGTLSVGDVITPYTREKGLVSGDDHSSQGWRTSAPICPCG